MLDELRAVPWPLAVALFLGGAAAMAILLVLVVGSDGGSAATMRHPLRPRVRADAEAGTARRRPKREGESPPAQPASIAEMVGERFMVGLRGTHPSPALVQDARRGEIGGVLLFPEGASRAATAAAIGKLQRAARQGGNHSLLIATDQEGGQVKRFPQGPPKEPLSSASRGEALREGLATGIFLRHYRINVDLAPVVDLGLPGSFMEEERRTISPNPNRVADIGWAFASGLAEAQVMPVAKHFPGLGMASTNTDNAKSVVEERPGNALEPYRRLIENRVPAAIMLSTAIYTKLDKRHGAAWSPVVVGRLLRHELGFQGLTISDDLSTDGVEGSLSIPTAVTESAQAGVDMLMIGDPNWFRPAHDAVLKAAREGQISPRNLTDSYERILVAKQEFAR